MSATLQVLEANTVPSPPLIFVDDDEDWSEGCDHNWIDMYDQDGNKIGTICSSCGASGG